MYVRELTVRYRLRRVRSRAFNCEKRLQSPLGAVALLFPILRSEIVEVCGLLCLSTRLDVLAYHELSRGTIDHTVVHARDVFRTALLAHASSIIVGHNHPSGDASPSADDVALTKRLQQAGEVVGIQLADHVIVTVTGRYYSFREAGML